MEFLAEFLFELFGEVMIDTGVDATSDHRRPRWQRVLILSIYKFRKILRTFSCK